MVHGPLTILLAPHKIFLTINNIFLPNSRWKICSDKYSLGLIVAVIKIEYVNI